MFFDLKNIITAFLIFLTLPVVAQNDLEGVLYGITLNDEERIDQSFGREWKFAYGEMSTRDFPEGGFYDQNMITNKEKYDYEIKGKELLLKNKKGKSVFEIEKITATVLIVKPKGKDEKIIFERQNDEIANQPENSFIPLFTHYKINTENNEFDEYQISFYKYDGILYGLLYENNKHFGSLFLDGIYDSFLESKKMKLLYANFEGNQLRSFIFNLGNQGMKSGLINGEIPFTLEKVEIKTALKKEDFINKRFLGNGEKNKFIQKLDKKTRTINVGNAKEQITFLNDTVLIMKKYRVRYLQTIEDAELLTYTMKWNLDDKGEKIYCSYYSPSRGFEKKEGENPRIVIYEVTKKDNRLILSRSTIRDGF